MHCTDKSDEPNGNPVAQPMAHAAHSPGEPSGGPRRQALVRWLGLVAASAGGWLAGCASTPLPAWPPAGTPSPATNAGTAVPAAPVAAAGTAAETPARNWDEYRLRAAQKIVAANQAACYMGQPPEPLLAIPVIEVELKSDGQIAKINVLRHPTQAKDTVQLAVDAIHRAAPFGDVRKLPKPWKYVEVFLFNDERKFKPRTLDN